MTIDKSQSWFASVRRDFSGGGVQRVWSSPKRRIAIRRRREPRQLQLEGLESRRVFSFTPGMEFTVGANPQAIAAADFNQDGWLDLITANSGEASVSVALGNGQGGFGTPNSFASGTNPRSLAVGDFNNDGKFDVTTANPTSGDVTTLLGNGDGTFQPPIRSRTLDAMPMSLAAADFNQDGKPDLAVGSRYLDPFEGLEFGVVSVLYGNGNGGFFDAGWYNLGGDFPADLAIVDFNRDGSPDVVTADADWYDHFAGSGTVSVLMGNATAPLDLDSPVRFATGVAPQAVNVGDVTGDGILDLVTAGDTVDVLRGLSGGGFAAPIRLATTGTAARAVELGDFNGNGTLDIVTSDAGTGNISVFPNNGTGKFGSPLHFAAGSGLAALAVADLNRDGLPDVAAARGPESVSIFLNDSSWPSPEPSVSVGDVTKFEGQKRGTTQFTFTIALSAAYDQSVTLSFKTVDGTAKTSDADYVGKTGTLTFAPGETTKTITIDVKRDRKRESDETFYLDLFGLSSNARFTKNRGIGTILNDD